MTDHHDQGARARSEALARSYFERVWNGEENDLGAIDQLMSDDYVIHSGGTAIRGRAAFKAWVGVFQTKLLAASNDVHEVFASGTGDRVATRWDCSGLNEGLFPDQPAGARISFSGIAIFRVDAGRLTECWVERAAPVAP